MGLWSKLFSRVAAAQSEPVVEAVEYKGFEILVEPRKMSGQYGVGARILKTIDGQVEEHRFIRADILPSRESCTEVTINKAKMTIDQLGEQLFRP